MAAAAELSPAADDSPFSAALARLASVAGDGGQPGWDGGGSPLRRCLGRIAVGFGLPAVQGEMQPGETLFAAVERLAGEAGLAVRQVSLRRGWEQGAAGPLLAFSGDVPRALLPDGEGYQVWLPESGATLPLPGRGSEARRDAALEAAALEPVAFAFYRRLPAEVQSLAGLVGFGLRGMGRDFLTLIGTAAAGALIGLVLPLATAVVFDDIVPGHLRGLIGQVAAAIALLALLQWLLGLANGVALLRLESRLKLKLQAALVDRLLHLPAGFFRDYSAGDLAQRTLGVEHIGAMITGSVATSLFAGLFSLFGLALLFHYHPGAALLAAGLSLLLALLAALASWASLRALRDKERLSGQLSGWVLELLNGMERLRLAGAERRVFARWAHRFADMREPALRAQRISAGFTAFTACYRLLALAAILGALAWLGEKPPTPGVFLAFLATFNAAFSALTQMATTVVDLLAIRPLWERMQPIVATAVEPQRSGVDCGRLQGGVEVSELHFRYGEGQPPVLRGLAFQAAPGEFVALVGRSGCGKSTLFRLLLGFEQPESGGVYFDGHDLAGLDLRAVRRQIGTVLQHDTLLAGSLFDNIRGSRDISLDAAWQAARLAGIEARIKALPMGMHTQMGDIPSFSGGEMQRLLLARALALQPTLLLLDEATSALDNEVQAEVAANLAGLAVTRIVIAHRLSTIVAADRIYVIDGGRIVQQGRFAELRDQPGLFAELVRQQCL
ncbi:MAG: hypothetical protein RIR00_1089 [Pseudomonadota bacterium]|jgi:ATP-binding cassette subfamily C protein